MSYKGGFDKYTNDYAPGRIRWVPNRSTMKREGMNLQNQLV